MLSLRFYSSEAEVLSLLWCDTEFFGKWLCASSGTKVYCLAMKMTVTQSFEALGATHPATQCHISQGLNPKQSLFNA